MLLFADSRPIRSSTCFVVLEALCLCCLHQLSRAFVGTVVVDDPHAADGHLFGEEKSHFATACGKHARNARCVADALQLIDLCHQVVVREWFAIRFPWTFQIRSDQQELQLAIVQLTPSLIESDHESLGRHRFDGIPIVRTILKAKQIGEQAFGEVNNFGRNKVIAVSMMDNSNQYLHIWLKSTQFTWQNFDCVLNMISPGKRLPHFDLHQDG